MQSIAFISRVRIVLLVFIFSLSLISIRSFASTLFNGRVLQFEEESYFEAFSRWEALNRFDDPKQIKSMLIASPLGVGKDIIIDRITTLFEYYYDRSDFKFDLAYVWKYWDQYPVRTAARFSRTLLDMDKYGLDKIDAFYDQLRSALKNRSTPVIFLKNIDKADREIQGELCDLLKGRSRLFTEFPEFSGRKMIFIMTVDIGEDKLSSKDDIELWKGLRKTLPEKLSPVLFDRIQQFIIISKDKQEVYARYKFKKSLELLIERFLSEWENRFLVQFSMKDKDDFIELSTQSYEFKRYNKDSGSYWNPAQGLFDRVFSMQVMSFINSPDYERESRRPARTGHHVLQKAILQWDKNELLQFKPDHTIYPNLFYQ